MLSYGDDKRSKSTLLSTWNIELPLDLRYVESMRNGYNYYGLPWSMTWLVTRPITLELWTLWSRYTNVDNDIWYHNNMITNFGRGQRIKEPKAIHDNLLLRKNKQRKIEMPNELKTTVCCISRKYLRDE
jgi:hypothetical protein